MRVLLFVKPNIYIVDSKRYINLNNVPKRATYLPERIKFYTQRDAAKSRIKTKRESM